MASDSDGGTAGSAPPQEREYAAPNEMCPHASSLHSPREFVLPKDRSPEYDFRDNNDLPVQYVQRVNRELRKLKKLKNKLLHFRRISLKEMSRKFSVSAEIFSFRRPAARESGN